MSQISITENLIPDPPKFGGTPQKIGKNPEKLPIDFFSLIVDNHVIKSRIYYTE